MTPSRISRRIALVKPSPTIAMSERAAQLRKEGRSIISFALGEPDFDTPALVNLAAIAAIEQGQTRYTATAGTPALRQAIADKLLRENGLVYAPNEIIVTCGAKHAIFNALAVTLNPGDEVIVPAPYWVSYPDMAIACDGVPVILSCDEASGFTIDAVELERAITPRTKWLILNAPSNPTGATYSVEQLRAVAQVLMRHPQVLLMMDDIYEHIRFDLTPGHIAHHILQIEPALQDRTVVINGVSKTYAMTGWRIGYAAAPKDIVQAMDVLQSQSTSNASSISQAAAMAALNGPQDVVRQWAQVYQERLDAAVLALSAIPGLSVRRPGGAFYLFVNCKGLIGRRTTRGQTLNSDTDVALFLLEFAGVAVLAGSAFGLSPYLRLSIATEMKLILAGCSQIAEAVSTLT